MRPVALGELLDRATPYERWGAPLDRRLRACVILSGAAIGIVLAALAAAGLLEPAVLGGLATALLVVDLVGLALFAGLALSTDWFRHACPVWHRLALAVCIVGALNGLVIALAGAGLLVLVIVAAASVVVQIVGRGSFAAHVLPLLLVPLAIVAPIALIKAMGAVVGHGPRPAAAARAAEPP